MNNIYSPTITTLPDSWSKSSFTLIGIFWMMNNDLLSPIDVEIRRIKDLGSFKASLEASKIDLFDRQFKTIHTGNYPISPFLSIIRNITKAVFLTGVFVIASPLGVIWHLAHCIYYKFLSSIEKRKIYFEEHVKSFVMDLWIASMIYAAAYDFLKVKKGVWRDLLGPSNKQHPSFADISILILPILLILALIPWNVRIYFPLEKGFFLKQNFGLVGEDGWVLRSHILDDAKDALLLTCPNGRLSAQKVMVGYFPELYYELGQNFLLKVLEIIELLQIRLEEKEVIDFSNNPRKILPHLQRLVNDSNENKQPLREKWIVAKKILAEHDLIGDLLLELRPSCKMIVPRFSMSPQDCQLYFLPYSRVWRCF
jgi:hypothetical protein